MRKISREAYDAFINNRMFNKSNTSVVSDGWLTRMYLFGNEIAKTEGDEIFISAGGYHPTATTRDRLSAFVNISIYKGNFIINNKYKWDGEWTNINEFN